MRVPTDVRSNLQGRSSSELKRIVVEDTCLVSCQESTLGEVWIHVPRMSNVLAEKWIRDYAKNLRSQKTGHHSMMQKRNGSKTAHRSISDERAPKMVSNSMFDTFVEQSVEKGPD